MLTDVIGKLSWVAGELLAAAMLAGCATSISGTVFVDLNHNGQRDANEPGVPGAIVSFERTGFVTTNGQGGYQLQVPASGQVWVRVPDGYRPGPVWVNAMIDDGMPATNLDLPLEPVDEVDASDPWTFVVTTDSHTDEPSPTDPWTGGDPSAAIAQALAQTPTPRFFTLLGDMTQGGTADEFVRIGAAGNSVEVPWVTVPGNHDWFDGGHDYRTAMGPDDYSFDVGNVHFVVFNGNLSDDDVIAFITADLANVPTTMTKIAFGHQSPLDEDTFDKLENLGIDYLFTGHWHANRRVDHGAMIEWSTQTLIMGGIDQTPAGYRTVTIMDGKAKVDEQTLLLEPIVHTQWPAVNDCAPATGFSLIAAAAIGPMAPDVTARIDCGAPIAMNFIGGWDYRGPVPALSAGQHSVELVAIDGTGKTVVSDQSFSVCSVPTAPTTGDWSQLGGSVDHLGVASAAITPPLGAAWATSVGGTVLHAAPVVADNTALITLTDLGSGDRGGIVALNVTTGAESWRVITEASPRHSPAINDGIAVVMLSDDDVIGLDLQNGDEKWRYHLGQGVPSVASAAWAAPTIVDGIAYVAIQGRVAAINATTGAEVWSNTLNPEYPWLGSQAAIAVAGGVAIVNTNRSAGMAAYDIATGAQKWIDTTGSTVAVNATPVVRDNGIDAPTAFVIDSTGDVTAMNMVTGAHLWQTSTTADANDWSYVVTAAPALAGNRLIVPTHWGDLVALDATSGAVLWRARGDAAPISYSHYFDRHDGFATSPVVTGGVVWIGEPGGALVALDVTTGNELWRTDLGAPIMASPTPVDGGLVVASFDGTVRALVPSTDIEQSWRPPSSYSSSLRPNVSACPTALSAQGVPLATQAGNADEGGCSTGAGAAGSGFALLLLVIAGWWRRARGN